LIRPGLININVLPANISCKGIGLHSMDNKPIAFIRELLKDKSEEEVVEAEEN
jgi:hypothetical protein